MSSIKVTSSTAASTTSTKATKVTTTDNFQNGENDEKTQEEAEITTRESIENKVDFIILERDHQANHENFSDVGLNNSKSDTLQFSERGDRKIEKEEVKFENIYKNSSTTWCSGILLAFVLWLL